MPPAEKCFSKTFWGKTLKQNTHTHILTLVQNHLSGWQNYVPLRFHNLQGILFVIRRLHRYRFLKKYAVARHRYRFADPGPNLFAKLLLQHPNSGILQQCPQRFQQTENRNHCLKLGLFHRPSFVRIRTCSFWTWKLASHGNSSCMQHHEKLCFRGSE